MALDIDRLAPICAAYGIADEIRSRTTYLDGHGGDDHKVILRVDFAQSPPAVIKLVHETRHPARLIEQQCAFSEVLRANGVSTPTRYAIDGRFCHRFDVAGIAYDVTMESYLGEEIATIDHALAREIGALMARNHRIAIENRCHIDGVTLFDFADANDVSGFPHFEEMCRTSLRDNELAQRIRQEYARRYEKIKSIIRAFPTCATQGDYSTNNMTRLGEDIGLFDFNNAGELSPFSDMLMEGLLVAHEMDPAEGLTEADHAALFASFFRGYTGVRALTDDEKAILDEAYVLAQTMWFRRILCAEDSLRKRIEAADGPAVDAALEGIWDTLQSSEGIL